MQDKGEFSQIFRKKSLEAVLLSKTQTNKEKKKLKTGKLLSIYVKIFVWLFKKKHKNQSLDHSPWYKLTNRFLISRTIDLQ